MQLGGYSALGAVAGLIGSVLAVSAVLTRMMVRRAETEFPHTGQSVEVEGVRIHYLDRGRGRPVVLIHGFRGSAYDFEVSITKQLARHLRVVAFDRPGHGYSDPVADDEHSLFVEARRLHEAVNALRLERPLLVGYSLGAAVALAYADAYADEVGGVVAIAGHVMPYRVHVGPLAFLASRPWFGGVVSHTLLVPVGRLIGRGILRRACFPQPIPPSYSDASLSMALRPRTFRYAPAELRQSARELRELSRRYRTLPVHVTIVSGAGDSVSGAKEARNFHGRLASSTLITVPDGGHALHATHPDVVAAAVRAASDRASASLEMGAVA